MKIRSRHHMRKDEIKELVKNLEDIFGEPLISEESKIELITTNTEKKHKFVSVDGSLLFFEVEKKYFPTVKGALELEPQDKVVTVDMGAIPYVVNGADIMAPGVVDVDHNIQKNDMVIVNEEEHKKAIAVGRALQSGDYMINKNEGKVVENLHCFGDDIWEFSKSF